MEFIPAGRVVVPWVDAWKKYKWPAADAGLCAPVNTFKIASMAGKHVSFKIKGSSKQYAVDPESALAAAEMLRSFYTNRDRQLVAVIPKSICYQVNK